MTDTPPPPHEPDPLEPDVAPATGSSRAVDPSAPVDPLDEAASATIDGLTPEPGATPVDPELLDERVRELAGITALLAEPVRPPEAGVIDAHIAAAVAALPSPESDHATVEHRPGPAVVPLAARRRRPAAGRWLAVAAAIAVVALAIPLVRSLSKSSTQVHDTAATATAGPSAADSSASSSAPSPELASPQSSAFSAVTTTTATPTQVQGGVSTAGDLGTVDTPQALTAKVAGAVPTQAQRSSSGSQADGQASTTIAPATTRGLMCDLPNRASHPDLGNLRYTATATYQSIPVEVAVYDVADSTEATARVIVTRVGDCEVVLDQLLP